MTIEEMRERKREKGYSCEMIAGMSGVPYATVQKIFGGVTRNPRRSTVEALEKVLRKPQDPTPQALYESYYRHGENMGFRYPPEGAPAGEVRESAATYGEKQKRRYTVEDYRSLPDDRRVELIDGVIYDMDAPSPIHQELVAAILVQLRNFLAGKNVPCRAFVSPFDVQLDCDQYTMVQPDILVLCSRDKLTDWGYYGAPDLVMEILSPSTRRKDMLLKLNKYSNAGVREYWMIDPEALKVIVYRSMPDYLLPEIYTFQDKVPVGIWEGKFAVDFKAIYDDMGFLYDIKK